VIGSQRVVAVVQARLGSSRLPRKVVADLGGRPLLLRIVDRIRKAATVDEVAVATSDDPSDDELVRLCGQEGIAAHRGPVDDIAARMHSAAAASSAGVLVRVWGDCPFVDPGVVDAGVRLLESTDADFVTNGLLGHRTYPPGLDFEAYRRSLLDRIVAEADDSRLREYPVEFVRRSGVAFELLQMDADLSDLHLTVDYPADLEAARRIYALIDERGLGPDLDSLLMLLSARPDLASAFADAPRNPEYRRYLESRARE